MYDYQFSNRLLAAWVLMGQTWAAMYKAAERQLKKVGLTPEQIDTLWVCRDYPGPLTPAELSRLLFRESQTVAGLVSRSEREGLVRRVPKRRGKPFTEVQITAKGEELCGPGIEVLLALIADIMSSLSAEELEQFQELLRKPRQKALEVLQIELQPLPVNPRVE